MECTKMDIFLLVLCLLPTVNPGVGIPEHFMCESENIQLKEAGETISIKSQGYPHEVPKQDPGTRNCYIYITAAASLKLQVHLEIISFPNCSETIPEQGSCLNRCDHLYMHEPDNPEQSTCYIFGGAERNNTTFTTTTRRLYIKFCRHFMDSPGTRFSLTLHTVEKVERISVISPKDYSFSSPYFPLEYNIWYGDDKYSYTCDVSGGLQPVLLNFTDWHLHPESKIVIRYYEFNGIYKAKTATMARPFWLLWGHNFTMEFHTGKDVTGSIEAPVYPYHLWRAQINVNAESLSNVISGCSKYFYDVWGGNFKVSDSTPCSEDEYLDCVFVVARKQGNCFKEITLRFGSLNLQSELGDWLEVRSGTTSDGPFLWRHFDERHKVFKGNDGFYIHFKGKCRYGGVRLSAVFASTRNINLGRCEDGFKCGDNEMYIPRDLLCDGVEHCFDGTDESHLLCQGKTTEQLCHVKDLISCNDIFSEKYCSRLACDGIRQCPNGEDEDNCHATTIFQRDNEGSGYSWGTIIPIVLSCLVVAFIICVVIGLFTRMKRAQRQSTAAAAGRRVDLFGVDDHCLGEDLPPPYEDVVRRPINQTGYVNPAFPLLQPPPYTPPANQMVQINSQSTQNPSIYQIVDDPTGVQPLVGHPSRNRLYRDEAPLQPRRSDTDTHLQSGPSMAEQRSRSTSSMLPTQHTLDHHRQTGTGTGTENFLNATSREADEAITLGDVSTDSIKHDSDTSGAVQTDDPPVLGQKRPKSGDIQVVKKSTGNKKKKNTNRNNKPACQNTSVINGDQAGIAGHNVCSPPVQISIGQGTRETAV